MLLYRVFPYLPGGDPDEMGGALYIPHQGGGRLDNPSIYRLRYLGDTPEGVVTEAFGRFPEWSKAILAGSPVLPGSYQALATYEVPDDLPICNLDDAGRLAELGLKPSEVVSWAKRIFREGKWMGIRWWSYYDSRWGSIGLWGHNAIDLLEIRRLKLTDPELQTAARVISRLVKFPR